MWSLRVVSEMLGAIGGTWCAALHGMTKTNTAHPPDPSNIDNPVIKNNPPQIEKPPTEEQLKNAKPWLDQTVMPADLKPTAAEYERDAQLERERQEAADKKAKETWDARQEGKLPPGAQTIEDARAQREKAEADAKAAAGVANK